MQADFLYPFERLNRLLADVSAPNDLTNIPLSLGEPRHAAPDFVIELLTDPALQKRALGTYPATRGLSELKQSIATWIERRFNLKAGSLDADTNVLPVNGTREALFAIAQTVVTPGNGAKVLMPNPFYQIYEGASLLAGANPVYLNCTEKSGYHPDLSLIDAETFARCRLVYINSPGNPCGAVTGLGKLTELIELADQHDFVIASDECYSEIYLDESSPPVGLLEACHSMGRDDYRRCLVFNSLSKRSNLPGLRSGFVAGDPGLIERFLLYRTYHGSAMPVQTQIASSAAWQDETHVVENREVYRQKFASVVDILEGKLDFNLPEGGFYLWPRVPGSDLEFTAGLHAAENVTVLPGSFLSRESAGSNPGSNRVRMALVAPLSECTEAATRIVRFLDR